jgi:uncharacterized membrane protein
MEEVFPPLEEEYGEQLQILEVNIDEAEASVAFQEALATYDVPEPHGVPTMVVGDEVMVGSVEIPELLPGLIEEGLAAGGVALPDLAGVSWEELGSPRNAPTWRDRYMQDPVGSTLSVVVLLGLIASLIAVWQPRKWHEGLAERFLPWGFLAIAAVGTVAAVYLSYVETTQTTAVCGPVGDCNAVQQSEYAVLFGFLPTAVLGLLGYVAILAAFAYGRWGKGRLAELAPVAVFLMAAFGVAFSAYLTFLEPFVIGATCMWCLTSAVSMAAILLLSAGPGWHVLRPPHLRRIGSAKRRRAHARH